MKVPLGAKSLYFEIYGRVVHSVEMQDNKSQDLGFIFIDPEQTIQIRNKTGGNITWDDIDEDTLIMIAYIFGGLVLLVGGYFVIRTFKRHWIDVCSHFFCSKIT